MSTGTTSGVIVVVLVVPSATRSTTSRSYASQPTTSAEHEPVDHEPAEHERRTWTDCMLSV